MTHMDANTASSQTHPWHSPYLDGELGCPPHLHDGLVEYIEHHRGVGHFLTAVLENDLGRACARADKASAEYLVRLVKWLYNYAPSACYGSPAKVRAWLATGEGR